MGLDPLKLVFPCDYIDDVIPLLEHYIHLDHKKIDLLNKEIELIALELEETKLLAERGAYLRNLYYMAGLTPFDKNVLKGKISDIENIIRELGSYKKKSIYVKNIAISLLENWKGYVPNDREYLESLSGIGRKTVNVFLGEIYNEPTIAVDTHVERVSKRLGIAKQKDSVDEVERKIRKIYKKEQYGLLHHQFIFFGRYFCKAIKPNCQECRFLNRCFKK